MTTDPHPLSKTDNGGNKMASKTRHMLIDYKFTINIHGISNRQWAFVTPVKWLSSSMNLRLTALIIFLTTLVNPAQAQYVFSGQVDHFGEGEIYLSLIQDYRKINGVYPDQIIARTFPDWPPAYSPTNPTP